MFKVLGVREIERNAWDELLKASSCSTWFQTYEAYAFFDKLSFVEAFAVGFESSGQLKGIIVGLIQKDGGPIKRFLSRRAIINGGPLLADNITNEELSFFLQSLKEVIQKKAIFIEMRNYNDYSQWKDVFKLNGFVYEEHYDVIVNTTSIDEVNDRLDRNRRRNIKKAIENGIQIDKNPSETDVSSFYELLNELYKTRVKTPLYPCEFFVKLRELPSSLFCVAKDPSGKIIGGVVCITLKGRAVYAWYACGEDGKYKNLSPSVMSNYAGICHAAENGFPLFDFMGAGKPDDGGYGVRDFKMKFGGELVEYGRYKFISNRFLYSLGVWGVKLLKNV